MTTEELRNHLTRLANDPSTPLEEMERVAAELAESEESEDDNEIVLQSAA